MLLQSLLDEQWCCRAEKNVCIFMIAIPAVTCYLFPPFRGALWRKLLAYVCLLASAGLFLLAWICLLMFACVCLLAASAGLFVRACFCLLVFACVCLLAFSCLFLLACFCLLASACCYYGTGSGGQGRCPSYCRTFRDHRPPPRLEIFLNRCRNRGFARGFCCGFCLPGVCRETQASGAKRGSANCKTDSRFVCTHHTRTCS